MCVFSQIFAWDEYACLRSIPSPRWILDLGANVGYSSAYFLSCFPDASVIAVEPDPENYSLCRRNLAPYGKRARVVLGAAWSCRARLALRRGSSRVGGEWASQVSPAGDGEASVEAYDIPRLLEMTGGRRFDILKADIERSELELFGHNAEHWLDAVGNLCIELHGADCAKIFFGALRGYDYALRRSGELTVCLNLRRRQRRDLGAANGPDVPPTAAMRSIA